MLALSFLLDDAEVTLCREDDVEKSEWVICTEAQLDPNLPGECRNNRNQLCALRNRVTEYRLFQGSAYNDGAPYEIEGNPWNKLWMGISTVVITHAVLQLIYTYAVLYTRLKVKPPPAGQADMRKQVRSYVQQTYIFTLLNPVSSLFELVMCTEKSILCFIVVCKLTVLQAAPNLCV